MTQPNSIEKYDSVICDRQRRKVLKLSAATVGLSMMPSMFALAASQPAPVGLQLYTVRDWMQVSVPGTLKLVAGVGYKELEFAGYFDHSPKDIRKMLDDEGLSAPSAHFMLKILNEGIDKVIDTSLEVGHKFIVLPYLTEEERGTTLSEWQSLAEKLNKYGEACAKQGITFAYHNHDFEFMPVEGKLPYDVLLKETDPELVKMELDLFWTIKAEKDPLAYFNAYPGRFPLWHVKDMDAAGKFADVGEGTIDFAKIFAQSQQSGVVHRFVEHDQTSDKLSTLQTGYKSMTSLLASANKRN